VPDVDCIERASNMHADFQIVAVAGSRVFAVERQRATECDDHLEARMDLLGFDLEQGWVKLTHLEQELPPTTVAQLREQAASALDEAMARYPWDTGWWAVGNLGGDPHWAADLWPDALVLSAVFPDYRSKHEDKALTLQYELTLSSGDYTPGNFAFGEEPEGMRAGSKDWSTWTWTTRVSMPLPKSSSLRAPEDAQALIEHVRREHRDWKVIGWSRRVVKPATVPERESAEPATL
jgi:hypothetical protein